MLNLGIEYVVLRRDPHGDLPARSTTDLLRMDQMPYRIDLAGGWLDQPFVSRHYPGSVITLSIEPTVEFNERSGMATSTRRTAIDLWGPNLPFGDPHKVAWMLFCCDNPPGTQEVSGAQDTIGLVFPGLARSDYAGVYWPTYIEHLPDEDALQFVDSLLYLLPLGPRTEDFAVLGDTHIDAARRQGTCRCSRRLLAGHPGPGCDGLWRGPCALPSKRRSPCSRAWSRPQSKN